MGGDKTLRFFRHAELKHGRVAMAATVGLLFHINHIHFPGYLSPTYGVSFESCAHPSKSWHRRSGGTQRPPSRPGSSSRHACMQSDGRCPGGQPWRSSAHDSSVPPLFSPAG